MQHKLRFSVILILLTVLGQTTFGQNLNVELRSKLTFPGQTLANICGWTSPTGQEYALVGASKGLVIVDITNPATPVQIVQIPGPDNLWKEIKTYSHYAYVTSEGGGGVQIVDLSGLPSATLQYHNYQGTGEVAGQINAIHALHIDVTKGYLYTYGGNFSHGLVHDLNVDPYNPTYVGKFDQLEYIHDGFADNDTLYACHIYTGLLSAVDMTDKSNPVLLGTVQTPGKFTHNAWIHSDRRHIFTTDEATPSFVTAYDVSDPSDMKEVDRFSIDNGNGSIGHNVHIKDDYAVTSWYTGGVVVMDVHRPDNMVKVAHYDTWAGSGPGFDGCWGAFPFFPSGTMIASNIEPGDLFILTPTYKRASYLEGIVRDGCNNQPLAGAEVKIVGGEAPVEFSSNTGIVKTGQVTPGTFSVTISKPGYVSQTITVNLVTAEVATFDVTLEVLSSFNVTGTVVDGVAGTSLAGIPVVLSNSTNTYTVNSDANGTFSLNCVLGGTYNVFAGQWGLISVAQTINLSANTNLPISLTKGYYDNFSLDYGWSVDGTASAGLWERGNPNGTSINNNLSNPENDIDSDSGAECYITGNGGGQAGADDVDNGFTTLISPAMDLEGYSDAILEFEYWFFNGGGQGAPNDQFEVVVSNNTQTVTIMTETSPESAWRNSGEIHLKDYIVLDDNVRVSFTAVDLSPGHLVEGGVDAFSVIPGPSGVVNIDPSAFLTASPNPSLDQFLLDFNWNNQQSAVLEVRNVLGQLVETQVLSNTNGRIALGKDWNTGVYFAVLKNGTQQSAVLKLIKG